MFAKKLLTVSLTFVLAVHALPVPHHARQARRELDARQKSGLDVLKELGQALASVLEQARTASPSSSSATSTSTATTSSSSATSSSSSSSRRRRSKTSSSASATSTATSSTDTSSPSPSSSSASSSTITSSASSSSSMASSASSAASSSSGLSQSSSTRSTAFPKPTRKACKGKQNLRKFKDNDRIKHKDPKNKITLFHATNAQSRNVQELRKGPKATCKGDFTAKGKSAFYLTDEITAAAQLSCYESRWWNKKTVTVFEYEWNPLAEMKTYNFQSANRVWRAFVNKSPLSGPYANIADNDMIAGPMRRRKGITRDYWQYAVTSDKGLKNLKLKGIHHNIRCKNIPRGNLCS